MAGVLFHSRARQGPMLGVLAGSRGATLFGQTARFGSVMAIVSAIKAGVNLAKGASGLAPKAKKLFEMKGKQAEMWHSQMLRAQRQEGSAQSAGAKARAHRRFVRYREKWNLEKIRQALIAEKGLEDGALLDGTAKEIRRNMLVDEWDRASPDGRVEVEKLIGVYDKDIGEIFARWKAVESGMGSPPSKVSVMGSSARLDEMPDAATSTVPAPLTEVPRLHPGAIKSKQSPVNPEQAGVVGLGGLGFTSTAPPGSGRLVRVAFYPAVSSQSYSGVNGIVAPGDDPVLLMSLSSSTATDFIASADYVVETNVFDYGKYRVLGLQCHHQANFVVMDNSGIARTTALVLGCAVGVRSVQVYNGEELLLPIEDLDAATFDLFGNQPGGYPGISSTSLSAYQQQAPYNFQARSKGFFMGLRTNPVVEGTAKLRMIVRCFVYATTNGSVLGVNNGFLANDVLEVPITFNVVGDMLEDRVMGDPIMPTPSSRAGAQVKLGVKDLGREPGGAQRLQIINPRYRAPVIDDSGAT